MRCLPSRLQARNGTDDIEHERFSSAPSLGHATLSSFIFNKLSLLPSSTILLLLVYGVILSRIEFRKSLYEDKFQLE